MDAALGGAAEKSSERGSTWRGALEAGLRPLRTRQRSGERGGGLDDDGVERLARALGWFSVGLGAAQVAAPRALSRLIGVGENGSASAVMRAAGARELATGAGILSRPRPAGWLWARVAGDAIDLAVLGAALNSDDARRGRVAAAIGAVAGVTVPDLLAAARLSRARKTTEDDALRVRAAITVNRPPEEVYRFWRQLENLPRFMTHLESVQVTGERRSHWKVKAPAGRTVEWDAEIVQETPNELIAWRSLHGADVDNSGWVRFLPAPKGRGTEVTLELRYAAPGGVAGAALAKLFGREPEQQAKDDLRRFKQVLETGEIVRSEGSPQGISAGRQLKQRPAQPLAETATA